MGKRSLMMVRVTSEDNRGPKILSANFSRDPREKCSGWPGRGGYLTFRRSRSMISSFHSWVRMSRYRSAATRM